MTKRKEKEDFVLVYSTLLKEVNSTQAAKGVLYSFKCCCGKEFEKYSRGIKSNVNCGCKKFQFKKENLEGLEVGSLTVLSWNESRGLWKCVCSCGKTLNVRRYNLITKPIKSCGCLSSKTHGKTHTKEYKAWSHLRDRCFNPNHHAYQDYGNRGIKVCDRWKEDFENFFEDMGLAPSKDHSVERLDVNGNYCPENCIWLERKYQSRNQRSTVLNIEMVKDIKDRYKLGQSNKEIADFYGINSNTVYNVTSGNSWKDC